MMPMKTLEPTVVAEPAGDVGLGGLLALVNGRSQALPLTSVKVRSAILGDCCRTEVEQRFRNTLSTPMEAVHIFPLPADGAIVEMELRAGEVVVRAECREREAAVQAYEQAKSTGQRAALLTQESVAVHTLKVANLPPGTDAVVRFVVIERLEIVDGAFQYRFPTVVAPKYAPGTSVGHEGLGVQADTDRSPDASRISPPLRLSGGTALDLEVQVAGPVSSVASSLHAVQLDLEEGGVRVAPSAKSTLDRDFVLRIRAGVTITETRVYTDGKRALVVIRPPDLVTRPLPRDAVFVVDISGSMAGIKMDAAKQALIASLHGLLPGDRFMLIAFDDQLERFRADFVPVDDAHVQAADAWVSALGPRGGTEMLPAIQAALAGTTPENRLRTVLFITDGQASNSAELVAAVANRRGKARFFTLGIDTAVNASLMKQLASVGGGTAELATPKDDIEAVVARLEARFGLPVADEVSVDGGTWASLGSPVLFAGRPLSLLTESSSSGLTIRYRTAEGIQTVAIDAKPASMPLGSLWARDRVAALEERLALKPFEAEALRPEILRVALEHGIASSMTAFVAIDPTSVVTGPSVTMVMPVESPDEWEESVTGAGATQFWSAPSAQAAPPPAPAPMPFPMSPPITASAAPKRSAASGARAEKPSGLLSRAKEFFSGGAQPVAQPVAAAPKPSAPAAERPKTASTLDAATLARTQGADGSYGGDVARTVSALILLILLGHTRLAGDRRRVVLKAATWLSGRSEPSARHALALLEQAERGERVRIEVNFALGLGSSLEALALRDRVKS